MQPTTLPTSTSIDKPGATNVRYLVLALLCVLAMITYLDRAVFANAKNELMGAVGQPADDIFLLLTAFQFAYALFEVPTGWMGDRFGPRGTLIRVVLWWSAFVGLTSLAGLPLWGTAFVPIGFTMLIVVQFCFGVGEAGAFPNITRSLYNWFPATQRGAAQGFVWMSARFMGGLTPLIWALLTSAFFLGLDWRWALGLFALVAVLWVIVFAWFFRNNPSEHTWTNQSERDLALVGKQPGEDSHAGVPWGKLFSSPNLWAICGMYFCMNFGWYFFMYFLPGFMKEQFGEGLDGTASGTVLLKLMSGGPLLLGIPGCLLGGYLTDRYVRRTGDRKWGRRLYGMIGFALASLCYVGAVLSSGNVFIFAACIGLAGFCNDLALSACWATCQDIGRRHAAIVSGFMNMIGNMGAALTNFIAWYILASYTKGVPTEYLASAKMSGYVVCLTLYAIAYAIGVFFWLRIDASKPLVPETHTGE